MTKPCGMRELNARLQVALRHPLDLTVKEFEFIAYLGRNVGKVCTRQMILESVRGPQYAGETHYLKVYAYRIRRKLHDEGGDFPQSDPSVGYRPRQQAPVAYRRRKPGICRS